MSVAMMLWPERRHQLFRARYPQHLHREEPLWEAELIFLGYNGATLKSECTWGVWGTVIVTLSQAPFTPIDPVHIVCASSKLL